MDFDSLRKAEAARAARGPAKAGRAQPAAGPGFQAALDKAGTAGDPGPAIASLLADIDAAAARFGAQFAPEALVDYKKAVRRFLEEFLARSHKRQLLMNHDPHATHDYVLLARNIDARLEELSRAFVTQEADQLQLLAMLDEIRGLLLDLKA